MWRFTAGVWLLWTVFTDSALAEGSSTCEQQPCQNGGVCTSHSDGFTCVCSGLSRHGRLYGGQDCSVTLTGCDNDRCDNGGVCSPVFADGQHTYTCACLPGFTGPRCQVPTVFSFEVPGYVHVETHTRDPEAALNVTLSFRSARPEGTLLQLRVHELLLSVQLMEGRLRLLSQRGAGASTVVQELREHLSDNTWHTVEAILGGVVSIIRLPCTHTNCSRGTRRAEVPPPETSPASPHKGYLSIGALEGGGDAHGGNAHGGERAPAFLGCVRDVLVDSRALLLTSAAGSSNVTMGCSDRDRCEESPCTSRGRCTSRGWRSYTCECHRPYEGRDCEEEYVTGRFGNNGLGSYAEFSPSDDLGDTLLVSMFVRTKQTSGLLLVLSNSTSQYLRLWLHRGRVNVQVNDFETLVGGASVADGHFHLVSVKLEGGTADLFQSAQKEASAAIRHVRVQAGDLLSVGGSRDSRLSAAFGGYFKGCVQDVRVNDRRLQFFPITSPVQSYHTLHAVNLDRGCGTDDSCAVKPCLNGGVCYSLWDDFVCHCPPSTAGRRCEQVKWCELSPCPAVSACHPGPQGFECLSNVTFGPDSGVLHYVSSGRLLQTPSNISLSFRTRRRTATLLHAVRDASSLTVSLHDSRLLTELWTAAAEVSVGIPAELSDGLWHSVVLSLEESAAHANWTLSVDGGGAWTSRSRTAAGGLDFLQEGADVFLGGLGPSEGVDFAGCLGPMEIGGLLLPFHLDSELTLPRPQDQRFTLMKSPVAPRVGCWGPQVCEPNPCQNQGVCTDLFQLQRCTCPREWAGPFCADPASWNCISSPCVFGNCTDTHSGFECVCEKGYGGERCEAPLDVCQHHTCGHGATCLRGRRGYACLCPQNTTGLHCDEKLPEIPWYIETRPFPRLPVTFCVGTTWNFSCFNGGSCLDNDTCDCLPGFTGQWCQQDVDECASEPCMNGGFCLNYVNSFECVCDINYSGVLCQMDVSDFYLYLFLGLWQNLFQLVSYLVIRMDDEPEIEWAFHIND